MQILTVTAFITYINTALKAVWDSNELCVEGEVTGFKISQGQWINFDLKDESGLINIFATTWQIKMPIEDGMKVKVFGSPGIYPKYGKFSLKADRVELSGEGTLKKALALLRARLEKEGIFDPSRKRVLPRFPKRIALVASRESAAYGDVIRILQERWGGMEIDSYHVTVQGEHAPPDIVGAIMQAQESEYDVLLLTRGGGSFEDLMCFNDERVVRAIYASKIPTLVAIGHERDVTLAEEAADIRGSTPTDCARRLIPDRQDIIYELATLIQDIESAMDDKIEKYTMVLERALTSPAGWVRARMSALDFSTSQCVSCMAKWVCDMQDTLQSHVRLLASLDPMRVLQRGYALVRGVDGHAIASVKNVLPGIEVNIQFADGVVKARTHPAQPTLL